MHLRRRSKLTRGGANRSGRSGGCGHDEADSTDAALWPGRNCGDRRSGRLCLEPRRAPESEADPGAPAPTRQPRGHHPDHGLHAALPSAGAPDRAGADRHHRRGSQLRAWWERMVAVLGVQRARGPARARDRPAGHRGHRLWCAGHHLCPVAAARRRRPRDHLRQGPPPNVRSSLATGVWSPDSRICLETHATAAFTTRWQSMARTSFQAHQTWLGLADRPVEFIDQYVGVRPHGPPPVDPRPGSLTSNRSCSRASRQGWWRPSRRARTRWAISRSVSSRRSCTTSPLTPAC